MNKKLQSLTSKRSLTDFSEKLAAKWSLGVQATAPSKASGTESTEDILRTLVSLPTTTGNYDACRQTFDYVESFLKKHKFYVKRLEWNGTESLIATTHPTKTPKVYLAGHIDVVPAEEHMFELKESGDNYTGRGVLDMKGAIAAYLGAVRELGAHNSDHDYGIMLTSDEEVGGFDGAKHLAKEGYLPSVLVLMDGGNNWKMERFAKGLWHLTIETSGVSAHGSRPWEGENAIEKLIVGLNEIKQLFKEAKPEHSTINIGTIQGGEAINQIPATASASIDMRFASEKDQTTITKQITGIALKHGLTLRTEVSGNSMTTDQDNPYIATFAKELGAVTGQPVEWVMSNAGTDGRFFAETGVQCAVTYPQGGGHHSASEWISKQSLQQMETLFVNYITKVAKK